MQRLKGKIAVVTGASRGVGRGIALVLGEEGATSYITARSVRGFPTRADLPDTTIDDTGEQTKGRGGLGIPVKCDHTVQSQIEALFERVKQEQGCLDILVNNAWGGYEEQEGPHKGTFWEWPISRWSKELMTGVWSTMVTSSLAVPLLLLRDQGVIINITLGVGKYKGNNGLPYHTVKTTINHMTIGMADDFHAHSYNIAVVGVSPGWTRTEAVMANKPPHKRPAGDELNMSESVEYVGRAVVALVTDPNVMSKTGQILHTRDLGREYGFTDIEGEEPQFYEGCKGYKGNSSCYEKG